MSEENANHAHGERRAAPARSEIAFPYTHLEDAVTVARAICDNGSALSRDQIAGVLGLPAANGGFSLKIGAARTFRLIEAVDGRYQLTELGIRILSSDEAEARAARRDAFLGVELYQKTFETFKGRPLPSRPAGIESAFVEFGVAPKQKDKARLAFERSAQFAGFFYAGKDKLVEPIINSPFSSGGRASEITQSADKEPPVERLPPAAALEPLIKGLLDRLPIAGKDWSLNDRAWWLRALAVNFAIIYGKEGEGEITITAPSKAGVLLQKVHALSEPAASKPAPVIPSAGMGASARATLKPESGGWDTSAGGGLDDEIPF
jgi:hypothetical protein